MQFALYVTPKKGATVPRFGAPRGTYIGVKRVGKQLEWDEERIVPIPVDEHRRYRAEYEGAIADGSLKTHKADAYKAQLEVRAKAKDEAKKKAAAEAAKPSSPANAEPANAEPTEAQRIHAIAETGATAPAPAAGERPRPVVLGKGGE